MLKGTPTPWSYSLIRLLFKFVLKIFYGSIVIENGHLIPENGKPCIICPNHSNSLTDAVLLVTSVPTKRRNMLRLTAKATQFGHKTFTSWLIESAGTVPIKRRKDYGNDKVDNVEAMLKLMEALEFGDAVCLFPEGMSRYHPTVAPLKTGVARLVSDVLTRNRDNPDFEISVVTCSITYMHREHFRSDVLVTFHPAMVFSPKTNPELLAPAEFSDIRRITSEMQEKISSGTFDSPSWDLIRTSKLAARIYAPLGTQMSLGHYVRLIRDFLDTFKMAQPSQSLLNDEDSMKSGEAHEILGKSPVDIVDLKNDLKEYQDQLAYWGIKDDRIRQPLSVHIIVSRLVVRITWAVFLTTLSLPGLLLWLPVFATTFYAVHNFRKTGPIFDTWDEIAQYKLIYGLVSGILVWFAAVLLTWPMAHISVILVPALMWMTLRWLEDAIAAFRAFASLLRLLRAGKETVQAMRKTREDLHDRVMKLAVETMGLPDSPETYFLLAGGREKGRVRGSWESKARYFSIRRRRKRDWNETLRLYDKVDYPDDD